MEHVAKENITIELMADAKQQLNIMYLDVWQSSLRIELE